MENNLNRSLEEAMQAPGVKGCLVADEQGLCLAAHGKLHSGNSGAVTALAKQARLLEPENMKPPTLILETDHKLLYIQQNGKLTAAVQKSFSP